MSWNGHYRIEAADHPMLTRIFKDGEQLTNVVFVKYDNDVDGHPELTLRIIPTSVEIEGDWDREAILILKPERPIKKMVREALAKAEP